MKYKTLILSLLSKLKRNSIPDKAWIEEGILLVDKPLGPTSFDVIRFLRKKMNIQKMGHAGTLDPLASGLLIIAIGKVGTRKITEYIKKDKTYIADILLGTKTDTGDQEGQVIDEIEITASDYEKIATHLAESITSLVGTHSVQAPLYSAIKVEGRPLYWYARRQIEPPTIPTKSMTVHSARLLETYSDDQGRYHIVLELCVASGVYIRAFAEFLGEKLSIPASLAGLRRTMIADWHVSDAYKPHMI